MSDKQREIFVQEMERIEEALTRTTSEKLRRDYTKALHDMKRELFDYDRFHRRPLA